MWILNHQYTFKKLLFLLTIVFFIGCGKLPSRKITYEDIDKNYPYLQVTDIGFKNILFSEDMDALIFSFNHAMNGNDIFLFKKRLADNGWGLIEIDVDRNQLFMSRINQPEKRYRDYQSVELIKIKQCVDEVVVGIIQFDLDKNSKLPLKEALGNKWASRYFWVEYSNHVVKYCAQ